MNRSIDNPITILYGLFTLLPWLGPIVAVATFSILFRVIPSALIHPPTGEQMTQPGSGAPVMVILSGIGVASRLLALPISIGIGVIWLAALLNRPRKAQRLMPATTVERSSPSCPECGADMKLRTARRGANAGSMFYGCSSYPRCKGTIDAN